MTDDPTVDAARDLSEIIRLAPQLEERIVDLATADPPGGDALDAIGPSVSPEAWLNRLDALDRAHFEACPKPDHSRCSFGDHADDADDEATLLWSLCWWSERYRVQLARETDRRVTLVSEATFLRQVLAWVYEHEEQVYWLALETDLATIRRHIEDLLHEGDRADRGGVPCTWCGTMLTRWPDDDGYPDEWTCRRCRAVLSAAEYAHAVARLYEANRRVATAAELADELGVSRSTIRSWASRGKVRRRGRDREGRSLFDTLDARRVAGRLTASEPTATLGALNYALGERPGALSCGGDLRED